MSRRPWHKGRFLWMPVIMILSAGGLGAWRFFATKADQPAYLLSAVDRGDLVIQVAAAGVLSAVTTVQVGSEVSGKIAELYVDFNSEVKQGQRLNRDALAGTQKALQQTSEASKPGFGKATAGGDGRGIGQYGSDQPDGRGTGPGKSGSPGPEKSGQKGERRIPVWILSGTRDLRLVVVQLGLSDGVSTQLVSGNLKEGDKLVTGVESNAKRSGTASVTAHTPKAGGAPPPPPPP